MLRHRYPIDFLIFWKPKADIYYGKMSRKLGEATTNSTAFILRISNQLYDNFPFKKLGSSKSKNSKMAKNYIKIEV